MDGVMDGLMNRQMDTRVDGPKDGWLVERMSKWIWNNRDREKDLEEDKMGRGQKFQEEVMGEGQDL